MKNKQKLISKSDLINQIAKKAKISTSKAQTAYETVLLQSPAFRQQLIKTVKTKEQVAVKVPGKSTVKKVNLTKEKAVKTGGSKEKIKIVEVKVPVPVVQVKEVIKEVQVVKEVPVVVEKTVIKEIKVVKEVPVEVLKEITLVREVTKEVKDESGLKKLNAKIIALEKKQKSADAQSKDLAKKLNAQIAALEKKLKSADAHNKDLSKKLAAKPKAVIKEVIKEVPVEVIREVEVVKQIDFASLEKMMKGMKTVEISKKVVGETRTKKEGKVVARREIKGGTKATVVSKTSSKSSASKAKKSGKDDLTKIEGIGPKIAELLNKDGIHTFKQLAAAKTSRLQKILSDAGPRYQMHNPGSWPRQSGLAADGKWVALDKLQKELDGGK